MLVAQCGIFQWRSLLVSGYTQSFQRLPLPDFSKKSGSHLNAWCPPLCLPLCPPLCPTERHSMEVWGVSAIQGDKRHFCWSNYSDLTRPGPPNDGLVTEIFEISPKRSGSWIATDFSVRLVVHPGKLTWNSKMKVWFRWFSFSIRWFLDSSG